MISVRCPVCLFELEIKDEPRIGHKIICLNCESDLEVIWLFPITVGLSEEKDQFPTPILRSLNQKNTNSMLM